ncbi:MAG TPA: universal stress protein [Bryobacteraceae bacterium]|nr:universal stress protein [Bryobacteraceae bacterium]
MINFQRILFPVDFSEQCSAIVPAVKAMAEEFHSQLILLHVVDLPSTWFGSPEAAAWTTLISAERLREEGQIALDRFAATHFAGFRVTAVLDEGPAGQAIAAYSQENQIDLIMMPTRGYGPFRAFLLGSVTAKVLHDAHCPVWSGVHAEELRAHSPERWRQVLCAVDTDPRDTCVLKWCDEFAAGRHLNIRLIHAVEGVDTALTKERDPSMYEFLFNVARERIAAMQADAHTRYEVCLLGGNVGRAVHQAAISHDTDLVVIGRGVLHKNLGRLRSSAVSIIQQAPCPVISI